MTHPPSPFEQNPANCGCYSCIGNEPTREGSWLTIGMTRMIVCALCGNKRCPHGTDHRLDCTGSNEGNQAGSRYQYGPTPCPNCGAGIDTAEHHAECVAPLDQIEEDA